MFIDALDAGEHVSLFTIPSIMDEKSISAAQPVLEISNLSVHRGSTLLSNINWTITHDEHWCILGPNGSGKTTLVNAITAYETPSSGSICLNGKEYGHHDWRHVRKRIGIVSHALALKLDSPLKVTEMVASGEQAWLNDCPSLSVKKEKKIKSRLQLVNCLHLADRKWTTLSQGERQRIMIARALFNDLDLLILDEPCAGLDPVAKEGFLTYISFISHQVYSPRIIYITHHVEEIIPTFTHTMILKDGTILKAGPTKDVLCSDLLTVAFGAPIRLDKNDKRFQLTVSLQEDNVYEQ